MSHKNYDFDGFSEKTRKTVKKKPKKSFVTEDSHDQRARRINFKNFIRKIREEELDDEFDDLEDDGQDDS